MLQLDAIYKAAHVLKEVVRRTDLIYAPQINPESTVYLKARKPATHRIV